jgi:hypothetical protein
MHDTGLLSISMCLLRSSFLSRIDHQAVRYYKVGASTGMGSRRRRSGGRLTEGHQNTCMSRRVVSIVILDQSTLCQPFLIFRAKTLLVGSKRCGGIQEMTANQFRMLRAAWLDCEFELLW